MQTGIISALQWASSVHLKTHLHAQNIIKSFIHCAIAILLFQLLSLFYNFFYLCLYFLFIYCAYSIYALIAPSSLAWRLTQTTFSEPQRSRTR